MISSWENSAEPPGRVLPEYRFGSLEVYALMPKGAARLSRVSRFRGPRGGDLHRALISRRSASPSGPRKAPLPEAPHHYRDFALDRVTIVMQ